MSDKIHDVIFFSFFRRTHDTNWLIECNKYKVISVLRLNELSVDFYCVSRHHLIADLSPLAIDIYVALLNKAVRISTGADTTFSDVFI